jgi:hypothetical protein
MSPSGPDNQAAVGTTHGTSQGLTSYNLSYFDRNSSDKKKFRPKKKDKFVKSGGSSSISFPTVSSTNPGGVLGTTSTPIVPAPLIEDKSFYKIEIRKLPPSDYNEKNFKESLEYVMRELDLPTEDILQLHFMEGKLRSGPSPSDGLSLSSLCHSVLAESVDPFLVQDLSLSNLSSLW